LQEQDVLSSSSRSPDVVHSLRLLPKFNEREPDVFFSLFEQLADARSWSVSYRTLLLQSVLTGKAQEAYAYLAWENITYESVKAAVLKAYELVPEPYRQRFRTSQKRANQSHMDFVRELSNHFNRWCVASSVDNFDSLCNLIILEQFKNCLPSQVATYLNECKVKAATEAAGLADEYILIHRHGPGEPDREPVGRKEGSDRLPTSTGLYMSKGFRTSPRRGEQRCHYCHEVGHWKLECPKLRAKGQDVGGRSVKPAALAASVWCPREVRAQKSDLEKSDVMCVFEAY